MTCESSDRNDKFFGPLLRSSVHRLFLGMVWYGMVGVWYGMVPPTLILGRPFAGPDSKLVTKFLRAGLKTTWSEFSLTSSQQLTVTSHSTPPTSQDHHILIYLFFIIKNNTRHTAGFVLI
eukprot:scaffold1995_cov167-Amphora_coffeaeformis.AAC.11